LFTRLFFYHRFLRKMIRRAIMRVKLNNRIYDTATAHEVGRQTVSFFGDPYGFEEIMFEKGGKIKEYFLLVNGGELSQYHEETIIPLNLADAHEWLARITGKAHADRLIPMDVSSDAPAITPSKKIVTKSGTAGRKKPRKQ